MSRPLAALASVILMVLGLMTLIPDCASACSCAMVGSKQERVKSALADSDAVFSGEVVDFEKSAPPTTMMEGTMWTIMDGGTATLRVSKAWKGPEHETVQVTTGAVSGMGCGYPFEEGQEYLVYARKGMSVNLCSETKPLSKAGADLALLGDGEKPEDDGDVLNDTSGGFSVRTMLGMAGLAMAASLLLVVRLVRTG